MSHGTWHPSGDPQFDETHAMMKRKPVEPADRKKLNDYLRIPAPPAPPACAGTDPNQFDTGSRVEADRAIERYCAVCPVKRWCLYVMRPVEDKYTGVAAGLLWVKGKAAA
jgi:hypothetical protein